MIRIRGTGAGKVQQVSAALSGVASWRSRWSTGVDAAAAAAAAAMALSLVLVFVLVLVWTVLVQATGTEPAEHQRTNKCIFYV